MLSRSILTSNIQGLMIIQMKKDKERGSEDLETFGHICEGLGAVFFGIFGGMIIGRDETIRPQNFFILVTLVSLLFELVLTKTFKTI
jgi:hypothetical protein